MPDQFDPHDNPPLARAWECLCRSDKHIFISGSAGTGKSTLLRHFIDEMSAGFSLVVTAPTGVAAINVGGETIHHFLRLPASITPDEAIKAGKRAARGRRASLYRELQILVIDEISMVRADLFDVIDLYLQAARGNNLPFGGVRLVCFGDLFQLPPVVTQEETTVFADYYQTPFFFGSDVYGRLLREQSDNVVFIELQKVYRQLDPDFVQLLARVRRGELAADDLDHLNQQVRSNHELNQLLDDCMTLTTTRARAELINQTKLYRLSGQSHSYHGSCTGQFPPRTAPTPEVLHLKIGARVMMLNNDQEGRWVNGSLGTISDLGDSWVKVLLDDDDREVMVTSFTWEASQAAYDQQEQKIVTTTIGTYTQLPLKLAWAVTIHKAQGQTFAQLIIDLGSSAFASGQTYVALSRGTSLSGIYLTRPITTSDIHCHPAVLAYERDFVLKECGERQFCGTPPAPIIRAGLQENLL